MLREAIGVKRGAYSRFMWRHRSICLSNKTSQCTRGHITARPHRTVMALYPFPKVRCRDVVTTCHIHMNEAALQLDAPPTAMSEGCPGTRIWRADASLLVEMSIPVSVMWPPARALP